MKKKSLHIPRKALIVLFVVVLLSGLLITLEKTHTTNIIKLPGKSKVADNGPTPEQKKQEAEVNASEKQKFIENNTENTSTTPESTPSGSQSIDLSAKQESNQSVTVFTKAYGYGDGTCNLTITNQTRKTAFDAALVYQPEYSSCAGFSVPTDSLGTGSWNLKLSITVSGKTTVKSISYEVK